MGNENLLFLPLVSDPAFHSESGQHTLFAMVLAFKEAYWSYSMAFKCKGAQGGPERQPSVSIL